MLILVVCYLNRPESVIIRKKTGGAGMGNPIKYLKIFTNFAVLVLGLFLAFYIGPKLAFFFMPFLIGWIIAMIANPLVKFLEKKVRILRKHSSMAIIIIVLGLIIVGGYFGIAKIVKEAGEFVSNAPALYKELKEDFAEIGDRFQGIYDKLPDGVKEGIAEIIENSSTYLSNMLKSGSLPTIKAAGNLASNLPSTLIAIVITILSSYFILIEKERITALAAKHVPDSIKVKYDIVGRNLKRVVGGYFKAQFKIMGIVALILFIGFLILGVHYAVLLALVIAILDFLPFLGTGTVLIPWALIKVMTSDYRMAAGLVIIYAASQIIRQVIQPKILGDTMGLNPLLTLIFMYTGYKFSGVLGMILAVPVGMIIINLFEAGIFDRTISDIKEIVRDINDFRKS